MAKHHLSLLVLGRRIDSIYPIIPPFFFYLACKTQRAHIYSGRSPLCFSTATNFLFISAVSVSLSRKITSASASFR